MILKTLAMCLHRPLLSRVFALFFCILFARGGLPSSASGCMFFIFFYVINMLLVCYDYLNGSDFLSLLFELFESLLLIKGVIC